MNFQTVSFREIGFDPNGWPNGEVHMIAIDFACQYLMDTIYCEFNECDVITNYRDIRIDWVAHTVIVPVRQVYKPEYLN